MADIKKPFPSLVADYQCSSSESGDDADPTAVCVNTTPKLPSPNLEGKVSKSVFSNPFREAEEAKLAPLETHVFLCPLVKEKKLRVCWKYERMGMCPWGHSCLYEHLPGPTVEPPKMIKRKKRRNKKQKWLNYNQTAYYNFRRQYQQ